MLSLSFIKVVRTACLYFVYVSVPLFVTLLVLLLIQMLVLVAPYRGLPWLAYSRGRWSDVIFSLCMYVVWCNAESHFGIISPPILQAGLDGYLSYEPGTREMAPNRPCVSVEEISQKVKDRS